MNIQPKNIAVCIILSIITCGIYGIYWFVVLSDEAGSLSGDNSTSGVTAFLLTIVTCGIYGIYWAYKMGERIDTIKTQKGTPSENTGILYLILTIFGFSIIYYALAQNEINKVVA